MTDDPYAHLSKLGDEGVARVMQSVSGGSRARGPLAEIAHTVIFGDLWLRPHLDIRDRRLVTLTALAMHGYDDITALHVRAALESGDVTPEQFDELVLQIGFYAGFPIGSGFNLVVQREVERWWSAEPGQPAP